MLKARVGSMAETIFQRLGTRRVPSFNGVVALGYIMGPEPDFTRRIPGLKIETPRRAGAGWGTRPISSEFSRRL